MMMRMSRVTSVNHTVEKKTSLKMKRTKKSSSCPICSHCRSEALHAKALHTKSLHCFEQSRKSWHTNSWGSKTYGSLYELNQGFRNFINFCYSCMWQIKLLDILLFSFFFKKTVNQLTYNQTCNSSNQCNYVVSGLTCSNTLSTCQCSDSLNYFKASTSLCGNLNFQCDILLYNEIIKSVFKNLIKFPC